MRDKCQYQNGFSLLEMLIAWALLSFMVISMTHFASFNLRSAQELLWRSVAFTQSQNLLEALRVTESQRFRQKQFEYWNQLTKTLIPGGELKLQCEAQACTVCCYWKKQHQICLQGVV